LVTSRIAEALEVPTEAVIWEAVELPAELSGDDRKMCEFAKIIVRGLFDRAKRAEDSSPV
jgi:hypothetical protein